MPAALKMPNALLDYVIRTVEFEFEKGAGWDRLVPYNWQAIRALAYLYTLPQSPLKATGRLAGAIRTLYGEIQKSKDPPDNRLTGHLTDAAEMLAKAGAAELLPGVKERLAAGAEHCAESLRKFRHLTHLTSANAIGTNHIAVYGCSVFRVGQFLENEEYVALARSTWDRLAADQEPDGFWAETTGGPTPLYNNLTFCCAGRMARWTKDPAYHRAAQLGALFHRRFSYPDGCNLETIDGRCRYHAEPMHWGGFVQSETPAGRAFVARKMETLLRRHPPGEMGTHAGETLALLSEDHQLWVDGPLGDLELDRPHYVEALQVPGAVRRQGPWFVALQGIHHLYRGWGTFTIDRTSLFSLWHERAELLVNGSGEPGVHRAQSFLIQMPDEKVQHSVPERARVEMGAPGSKEPARLSAEYRGGTARLAVHFVSDTELRLEVGVGVRTDRYPVPFTLQLELRDGDRINGRELGAQPLELTGGELHGKIETKGYQLAFPAAGAKFIWPHDPYNPYYTLSPDGEKRTSPRNMYVSLLTLPVGPEGLSLTFLVP